MLSLGFAHPSSNQNLPLDLDIGTATEYRSLHLETFCVILLRLVAISCGMRGWV